jgi:hypothetical protein
MKTKIENRINELADEKKANMYLEKARTKELMDIIYLPTDNEDKLHDKMNLANHLNNQILYYKNQQKECEIRIDELKQLI